MPPYLQGFCSASSADEYLPLRNSPKEFLQGFPQWIIICETGSCYFYCFASQTPVTLSSAKLRSPSGWKRSVHWRANPIHRSLNPWLQNSWLWPCIWYIHPLLSFTCTYNILWQHSQSILYSSHSNVFIVFIPMSSKQDFSLLKNIYVIKHFGFTWVCKGLLQGILDLVI